MPIYYRRIISPIFRRKNKKFFKFFYPIKPKLIPYQKILLIVSLSQKVKKSICDQTNYQWNYFLHQLHEITSRNIIWVFMPSSKRRINRHVKMYPTGIFEGSCSCLCELSKGKMDMDLNTKIKRLWGPTFLSMVVNTPNNSASKNN